MVENKGTLTFRMFGIPRNLDDAILKIRKNKYERIIVSAEYVPLDDLTSLESDIASLNAIYAGKKDDEHLIFYELTGKMATGWNYGIEDSNALEKHSNKTAQDWKSYMESRGIENISTDLKDIIVLGPEESSKEISPAEPLDYVKIKSWFPRFAKPTVVSE